MQQVEVYWGVLPSRVDFIINMYKIPENKTKLLVMGAEKELIEKVENKRTEYGINQSDFLIVTGGKIDSAKRETIDLMKAVNKINDKNLKLLIFGSVDKKLLTEFNENLSDRVKYIGWIDYKLSYSIFKMGILVVFPGRHSVFWNKWWDKKNLYY